MTLARTVPPPLYTYPARPLNGGPFTVAPVKRGLWAAEPKFNGWRALVHIPSGTLFNRHGERLSIGAEFAGAVEILRATLDAEAFEWADCEALERRHAIARGTLIVLDVIPKPGAYRDHTPPDYTERRSWLTPLAPPPSLTEIHPHSVYLAPSTLAVRDHAACNTSPQAMWEAVRAANKQIGAVFYEGIVMKRCDSLYPVQLRNPDETTPAWVKHRWHF
jgi:ATP-dependent DNA ligase